MKKILVLSIATFTSYAGPAVAASYVGLGIGANTTTKDVSAYCEGIGKFKATRAGMFFRIHLQKGMLTIGIALDSAGRETYTNSQPFQLIKRGDENVIEASGLRLIEKIGVEGIRVEPLDEYHKSFFQESRMNGCRPYGSL